jgi:hypothetical protein
MLHISNTDTLKSVYFSYFHSLIKYGIIIWSNTSDRKNVFALQKKIVRFMMGIKSCNSCEDLFKRLETLSVPCACIFSLMNLITNDEGNFQTNADVHSFNTKHKHYLHKPIANLSCFQKSAYYAGIKIFNNLPSDLKSLMMQKHDLKYH